VKTEKNMPANDTALLIAMEVGDIEDCRICVKAMTSQNVNYQSKTRNSALHSAVELNLVEIAGMLLKAGADMMTKPSLSNNVNQHEIPLWMAFKMGESRVEMQLLFLETIAAQQQEEMYANAMAVKEIAKILHMTMLCSTPFVFSKAMELFPNMKQTDMHGLTPLMYTLRQVSLYEQNSKKYTKRMQNVLEIVEAYPFMMWERYRCSNVGKGQKTVCKKEGSTALGMMLFETLVSRGVANEMMMRELLRIEKVHDSVRQVLAENSIPPVGNVSHMFVYNEREALKTKTIDRNAAAITFFTKTLIPSYFSLMAKPLHVSMQMAFHPRLGGDFVDNFGIRRICRLKTLNPDLVKQIFETFVLSIRDDASKFRNLLL